MKNKIYFLIVAILTLSVINGCKTASSNNDDNSQDTNAVTIQDSRFTPSSITVQAGTTVTWTHKGTITHTVTSGERNNPDGLFNSGDLNNGGIFSFTFNTPGTYKYFCFYHIPMTGTVIVK